MRTEVVVVGAGGAGLPAAVAALESGASSVVVVEARNVVAGNAAFATGIFACQSPIQRKMMIDVPADEVFAKALDFHHGAMVNPRVLRAYIGRSGDTIRWLTGKGHALKVAAEMKMSYEQHPTWHVPDRERKENEPLSFKPIMRALAREVTERGGTILLDTSVERVLCTPQGEVAGVVARSEKGEFEIHAPAVVIASGGFHGNAELMKKYFWFYDDSEAFEGFRIPMDGSGIELAAGAGGAVEPFATLVKETALSSDHPKERALGPACREPTAVWVNRLGRRFAPETVAIHLQTGANPLMLQPGKVGFALYDEEGVQSVIDDGWLLPRSPDMGTNRMLRDHLAKAAARGEWAVKADDWDLIADWIACPQAELAATVERYNGFADHGYDEEFVKQRRYLRPLWHGPFYAIKFRTMIIDTAGPVRVDERMRVLDPEFAPIPGLYAAGAIAAGWQGQDYCGQHLFGSALGFAINSGRIAGESAGAHVK